MGKYERISLRLNEPHQLELVFNEEEEGKSKDMTPKTAVGCSLVANFCFWREAALGLINYRRSGVEPKPRAFNGPCSGGIRIIESASKFGQDGRLHGHCARSAKRRGGQGVRCGSLGRMKFNWEKPRGDFC